MIPSLVVAHALHDSAALGLHPATLAVAVVGVLTVAVVLPQRAEEPRVALPEPGEGAERGAGSEPGDEPEPGAGDEPEPGSGAGPGEAAEPAGGAAPATVDDGTSTARAWGARRVLAVVPGVLAVVAVMVGVAGPRNPNLAALLVANVVLPATVVIGLLGGGPRPWHGPAPAARPSPLTWALLLPLTLSHPAGSAGGTVAGTVVAAYLVVTTVGRGRHGPGWWSHGDPLGVLAATVRRLSPLARSEDGSRRAWLSPLWDPLTTTERTVIGVLLAAAIARAARFVPVWQELTAGRPLGLRTAAAALLIAYVLVVLVLVRSTVARRTGADLTVAVLPLLVALLLANDLAPALFSLNFAGTLLSDPLGTGADLFGTADRRIGTGLLSSPLVWLFQLVTVLIGGILAATVQRDLDRADGRTGVGPAAVVAAVTAVTVGVLLIG